ncbi:MAG: hypothetical protein AAFP19_15310 [Bacteroidota bacterium]
MKTKCWFLFFFLFISCLVQAQNPGYLGKKATLLVNIPSFPTIVGPSWNNRGILNSYGEEGGGLAISPVLEFQFGYSLSRIQQLYLDYSLFRTGAIVEVSTRSLDPFAGDFGRDEHDLFYQLSARTISIGRKEFNVIKGAIAPLGTYSALSLKYTRISGSIADKRTSYIGQEFYGHAPILIDDEVNFFALGIDLGRQNIYWDRFMTNWGFRVNIPLNLTRLLAVIDPGSAESFGNDTDQNQETYYQRVFERVALHSFIQFNVGVGLLLF